MPDGIGKLSVVVFSGTFERVHYALVMASAAAAVGRKATLFFTMDACKALLADGGWRALPVEGEAPDAARMDADFQAKGVGTFEELLTACVEMEVVFMVCEMGLRARGLEHAPLRSDVPVTTGGVVTFLNDAEKDGAVIFI
jgi:peroxiredoxin family protein